MIQRLLFILFIGLTTLSLSAQLRDDIIKEMAVLKADRWQSFLNLSDYRRNQLVELWFDHERNKSEIVKNPSRISHGLVKENNRFIAALSQLLTPKELAFYKSFEEMNIEQDKVYLRSLMHSISQDSQFVREYLEFQYQEVLPVLMNMRESLNVQISREDLNKINTIRNQVYNLYDKCLVTCLAEDHENEDSLFLDLGSLLLVEVNKSLLDKGSSINQLLRLVKKYEDQIHNIKIANNGILDSWAKQSNQIKEIYILSNYSENLKKINSRSDLLTLKHIESEAIFLLIDPLDKRRSQYFLNFGIYSQL